MPAPSSGLCAGEATALPWRYISSLRGPLFEFWLWDFVVIVVVLFCKTGSCLAQAGLKLTYKQNLECLTIPPLLPQCWGSTGVLLMSAVHLARPASSSQKAEEASMQRCYLQRNGD